MRLKRKRLSKPEALPPVDFLWRKKIAIATEDGYVALSNLQASGIKVIIGVTGSIDETIDKFLNGSLKDGESICEHGKGHICKHLK